jgi:hypothetical protein
VSRISNLEPVHHHPGGPTHGVDQLGERREVLGLLPDSFEGIVAPTLLDLGTEFGGVGGTVPLILRRLKIDPAVASGPLLTTITDMCGFFLVLSMASLTLSKLT